MELDFVLSKEEKCPAGKIGLKATYHSAVFLHEKENERFS